MRRSWRLGRRACLRGAGGVLALPALEAMLPDVRRAEAAGRSPQRCLVFFVFAGGVPDPSHNTSGAGTSPEMMKEGVPGSFFPAVTGAGYRPTQILEPLADLKDDVLVVSNLHNGIGEVGTGKYAGHDHNRSADSLLTGMNPEWADGDGPTRVGISVDQRAAQALRTESPILPSLVLGDPYPASEIVGITYSWRGDTTRNLPVTRSSDAFRAVFGESPTDAPTLHRRLLVRKQVLDYTTDEIRRLKAKLGKSDQDTLDKYLTSVRDLEERIDSIAASPDACAPPGQPALDDSETPYARRVGQWIDLVPLAFQCDRTRVVVIQLQAHYQFLDFLGPPNSRYHHYHDDVEHGASAIRAGYTDVPQRAQAYVNATRWMVEQFGKLARRLKETPAPDGTGTLLDNTMMVCTSELSYGNGHNMRHLPVIVAGRGGGIVTTGRHIAPREQPIANLWLTMLSSIGVPLEAFGNSDGALSLS